MQQRAESERDERVSEVIARVAKSFDLSFEDGEQWTKLPEWAKYLIHLGSSVAQAQVAERCIIVAISLPTSSYAAAFIALGRVLTEQIQEPTKSALDDHFQQLTSLNYGTPLVYFNGEALYRGPFLGVVRCSGQDCIGVSIKGGKCFVPKSRCLLVEPQPQSDDGLPLTTATGRLRNPKPFVSQFYTLAEHYRVLCNTRKSVLIVGEKNRLRTELQSPFQLPNGSQPYEGTLQDLIRVAKFSAGGVGCRSDVLPHSRSSVFSASRTAASGTLVVLDGAVSMLKWAHRFPGNDSVCILSRTEAEFATAIDTANERYVNRLDDCFLPGLGAPPPGVEIMAHIERR